MIKLIDILFESFLAENFYSVNDSKLEYPLTQYILDKLKSKLPGLKISQDPKLEASGAEGIVISLDDYKVIKLFFSKENAVKSVPLLNKNLGFTAKIFSTGTIHLDEKVKYIKKGSNYSESTNIPEIDNIYYIVMERIVPDPKTYNDVEIAYIKFAYLKEVNNIENFRKYLTFTKGTSLEDFVKENILQPFLTEYKITSVTSEELYNSNFNPNNISKKELNNIIQLFFQWKKTQTKTCLYIFGEKNSPLLLKWALLCYLGKYKLDYDIKILIDSFYNSLPSNLKEKFNEILNLLKDIVVTNKINWKDIHKEQFGRLKSDNKLVAIDIGVKSDDTRSQNVFDKNKLNVDLKSKARQSVTEQKNSIEELNFFDFDGTLFLTPGKEKGEILYKKITGNDYPYEGWAGKPESLLPEYDIPINPRIISHLKKALSNPNAKNFLLTNRTYKLSNEVKKILSINNIIMDDYLFKQGDQSKSYRIEQAFEKYPSATVINVYDDKPNELQDIDNKIKEKYNLWYPELNINLYRI